MTEPTQDLVSAYLRAKGEQIEAVYFQDSAFFLGWKLCRGPMQLIYRLDKNQLIICDFLVLEKSLGMRNAARQFIRFAHEIKKNIPAVQIIKGAFVFPMGDTLLRMVRQRWVSFLERQGGRREEKDGLLWLVF